VTRASARDLAVHKAGRERMGEAATVVSAKRDSGRSQEVSIHPLEQKQGLHR